MSPLTLTRTREVVPIGPTPLPNRNREDMSFFLLLELLRVCTVFPITPSPTRTREGVSSLLLLELGRMCPSSSNRSRVEYFPSTFIKLGRMCPLTSIRTRVGCVPPTSIRTREDVYPYFY